MKNSYPPKSLTRTQLHGLGTSACALAIAMAAASPVARATDVYWDRNGATTGAATGGIANGTWDAASTGNWTTNSSGTIATMNYSVANGGSPSTADVFFSAGTDAITSVNVTLTGPVAARSITVQELLNITSATGTPSLAIGSGGVTLANTVVGTSTWVSTLPVTLSASQSWNNNSNFLFTMAGTLTGAASSATTLTFSGTGSGGSTLSGAISNGTSGTTSLAINTTGGNVTTLSNSTNSFSGGTTLTQGILRVSQSGASGTTLGNGGLFLAGGELRLVRGGNTGGTTFTGANTTVTGDVRIVSEVGTGTTGVNHTLGTLNAGAQSITVAAGSMVTAGTAGVTFGATTLTGSTVFDIESAAQLTLGALTGSANINKDGAGKLILNAATTTFSGGLNITEGTVNLASATALGTAGTAAINLGATGGSANATLEFGTSFSTYSANPIFVQSGAGTRTITASGGTSGTTRKNIAGAITLANDLTIVNQATHSGNSGVEFSGGFTGVGNLYLENSPASIATALFLTTGTINHTGSIVSSGSSVTQITAEIGSNVTQISHTGPGTLLLGGANASFTGGVTINSGTLRMGSNSALNSANTLAIGAAATMDLKQINSNSYDATVAGLNDISGSGGQITNTAGTVRTLTLGGSGNYAFSGSITSAIVLVKNGSGTQVLSGTNTFSGNTTVNAGTLLVEGSLASSLVNVTGGILGGSGSLAGTVSIGSGGALSPGSSPGTITVSGLNMLNGSNLVFEGGDLVNVTNQLDLDTNWTLTLGSGFTDGGSVVLYTFGTLAISPDLNPTFNTAGLGFSPTGPLSLSVVGNTVVLNGISVIPEPSTTLLAAAAGTVLLVFRRRNGRR